MGKEKWRIFSRLSAVQNELFWKFHGAGTYVSTLRHNNVQVTIFMTCLNFAGTGSKSYFICWAYVSLIISWFWKILPCSAEHNDPRTMTDRLFWAVTMHIQAVCRRVILSQFTLNLKGRTSFFSVYHQVVKWVTWQRLAYIRALSSFWWLCHREN